MSDRVMSAGRGVLYVAMALLFMPMPRVQGQGKVAGAAARDIKYDVVTIKPNKSGSGSVSISTNLDSYSATNVSLLMMLQNAYGIKADLISGGPGWSDTARFDIKAKVLDVDAAELKARGRDEYRHLLQTLLEDRFRLKVHVESKVLPVFDMVVLKGGPKFKQVEADESTEKEKKLWNGVSFGGTSIHNSAMTAHGIPMASLASQLSAQLHRMVVDRSELAGNYDLQLNWTPDDGSPAAAEATAPSIFTAVQEQLGLKLQASKGPVDTLVIDHVEMPSEN